MTKLLLAALPALAFLALPFLASVVAALGCAAVHHGLKRALPAESPAGPWLLDLVRARRIPVRVALAPEIAGSMDGYWPDIGFIGLSPRTWTDSSSAGRAVAAHELGHALAWRERPEHARHLALGRKLQQHALSIAGAGFLTAALMDSRGAALLGLVALIGVLLGHLATLVDEADASLRAREVLDQTGHRTVGTDLAMLAALGVYLAPAAVHLGFLAAAPAFLDALLTPTEALRDNGALGLWAILLLAPFLLLRAAAVLVETRTAPARPETEFSLNWTLFQERSWEFHAAVIVLLWLALTYDQPVSTGLAPLFLLGAVPAMSTLGNLGKMLVVLPIWFVLALAGLAQEPPRRRIDAPDPPAVFDLMPEPVRGAARLGGLVRVAWLPLLGVLVTRAVSGW